jgi:hypothetical protein
MTIHTWYIEAVGLLYTLLGIITAGLLTTGENKNREKYGGIPQNPPHYPGRKFTSDQPFNFQIVEITEITEI